jgi:cell division transport system ATP-binding protein
MLKLDQVSKRYADGGDALINISCHLQAGEMAFLTGHSGAGKSTLLKLIALIERPTNGQVYLDGQNLNRIKNRQIPLLRRKLGLIFQDYKLLIDRSVYDNVALPLVVAGYSRQYIARRVRGVLDKVGLLSYERRYPLVLSGGEQQRVGIARALVNRPALILADEPTGNLDRELSAEIMKLFLQFSQVGVTVLIATHDATLVSKIGKRVIKLDQGKLL